MSSLELSFAIIWGLAMLKKLFFWVWFWQLKEYHLGRVLAHFDTYKGKRLLFNLFTAVKLGILALYFIYFNLALLLTIFIFSFEAGLFAFKASKRAVIFPRLTFKALYLVFAGLATLTFIGAAFLFLEILKLALFPGLLFLDIISPLIFSSLVLGLEPAAVMWRKKLMTKARAKRETMKGLIVVGITGSYGKTSTKEILAHILSKRFKVIKTKEHENSEVGISRRILKDLSPEHQIFVCEMGAYQKGGIKMLCDILGPSIGILTGINQQHLATFGSQQNIIDAKFELLEYLPESGTAILNYDSKFVAEGFKAKKIKAKKIRFYGLKHQGDVWAEEVRAGKDSLSFKVESRDGQKAFVALKLAGRHNIENILGAILTAKQLGMGLKESALALRDLEYKGAMVLKKGKNGVDIIDSSYSANPYGVIQALEHLKLWQGKKAVVMPCLIELGSAGREIHARIGEKIAEVCDFALITAKDYYKEIKNAAAAEGLEPANIVFEERPSEIFKKLKPFLQEGNVILFEGRAPQGTIDLFL